MNLNRVMVVDGERDITFHKPLATSAHITADSSVLDVFDKGKDKGAVIRHKTVLRNDKGEELATLVASRFARGDGGFGGPAGPTPPVHPVPDRAPDLRNLHRVGEPCPVEVVLPGKEDLGLRLELPEGVRMDDPVAVDLEGVSVVRLAGAAEGLAVEGSVESVGHRACGTKSTVPARMTQYLTERGGRSVRGC